MAEVQIDKMRIRHEQILNWLLLNPDKTQNECAEYFGVTPAWLSVVINSDCFRVRRAELTQMLGERVTQVSIGKMRDVVDRGLERLSGMVTASSDPGFVLETTDKLLNRLGFGAKGVAQLNVNVQNNSLMVSREVLQQARGEIVELGAEPPRPLPAPQELPRVSADGHTRSEAAVLVEDTRPALPPRPPVRASSGLVVPRL